MTKAKPTKAKEPTAVVAGDQVKKNSNLSKAGGSQSNEWNGVLIKQALGALWMANSDEEQCDKQFSATLSALLGIAPRDEMEGMLGAQLIASHNAAMECFRRAMIIDQPFEARRENLNQANKLSRTYTALLESLNRHRGKGQQKVTVEHVHVHEGGQAIVGSVDHPRGGGRTKMKE